MPKYQELTFEDLVQMVEKASSKLSLKGKGRYLVARCALKAGDVVVCETPLFEGNTHDKKSEKVYSESFLEKLHATHLEEHDVDDCFHPRSPLMDCVAAVLLCKQQARDKATENLDQVVLKLQKFCALCRSPSQSTDHRQCAEDLWGALKPEFQEMTSHDELGYINWTLCPPCPKRFPLRISRTVPDNSQWQSFWTWCAKCPVDVHRQHV